MADIDTADVVLHRPTGEEWLVAYVANGKVCCCGWPLSYAPVSDCDLVRKATAEERADLIRRMAEISQPDPRRSYALEALATESPQ